MIKLPVAAACLLLAACSAGSGPSLPGSGNGGTGELIAKEVRQVTITSPAPDTRSGASTTSVPATVFIPEHIDGETYPLIVHSHGFGAARQTAESQDSGIDSIPLAYFSRLDQQIAGLVAAGYAVISFDERGFGDSSTEVKIMHPDFETQDAIAVIDWAVANLALTQDRSGDPLVGTLGGSYGGGFQHSLAQLDPRVDAMIPSAAWYTLENELTPNGFLKKSWLNLLCLAALNSTMGPELAQACQSALLPTTRFIEDLPDGLADYIRNVSWSSCQQQGGFFGHACRTTPVDVLLIQGQRDVLVPVNEVISSAAFYSLLGGDVRIMTIQGGHINPGIQAPDGRNVCGEFDVFEVFRRWYDAKLKGIGDIDDIPTACISLDNNNGAAFSSVPRGGAATVTIPASTPVQAVAGQAVFVPLDAGQVALAGEVIAGIPVAENLQISGEAVFIGVAVRRAGALLDPTTAIDEQVSPLRGSMSPIDNIDLMAIGELLQPGDVPGILIMADHPQYEPLGSVLVGPAFGTNTVQISGQFHLPLVTPDRLSVGP